LGKGDDPVTLGAAIGGYFYLWEVEMILRDFLILSIAMTFATLVLMLDLWKNGPRGRR
jgi:hypothetical protein